MGVIHSGTMPCLKTIFDCDRVDDHRHPIFPRLATPSNMREWPEFTNATICLAEYFGLKVLHIPDARRLPEWRGWPDLTIFGGPRQDVRHRELKNMYGTLTPEQREVGLALPEWRVWRPSDLYSGQIEGELRDISR